MIEALFLAAIENLHERRAAQLQQCEARKRLRFVHCDRATIDRPQKVVQQALPGSRVVEYLADERSG